MNYFLDMLFACGDKFVKWFDLHLGWFFTNGNKKPGYLKKYHPAKN